ncbi:MAG: hypothetical protein Q4F27_01350 [Desulfovibrionaceae bacterium]|nr:hypothetical protein [Desulfovibrionaceae bacterium]
MLYSGNPSLPQEFFSPAIGVLQGLSANDYLLSQMNNAIHSRTIVDNSANDYSAANTPEMLNGVLVNAYS